MDAALGNVSDKGIIEGTSPSHLARTEQNKHAHVQLNNDGQTAWFPNFGLTPARATHAQASKQEHSSLSFRRCQAQNFKSNSQQTSHLSFPFAILLFGSFGPLFFLEISLCK